MQIMKIGVPKAMKKTVSIKENKDFKRLYYRGKSVANDLLAVYYRKNSYSCCRLGLTVSGKVGNAVVRNRVRRLIKESYRLMEERVRGGTDIVVVARGKAASADFHAVNRALEDALKRSGILN